MTGPDHAGWRFTTEWGRYGIEMHHDVVRHPDWPEHLKHAGYAIGDPPLGLDPASAIRLRPIIPAGDCNSAQQPLSR